MFERMGRLGSLLGTSLAIAVVLGSGPVMAQEIVQTSVSLSDHESTLALELADGGSLEVSLSGGNIYIDGAEAGAYTAGGVLETAWRELLTSASGDFKGAWAAFDDLEAAGAEGAALESIRGALEGAFAGVTAATAPNVAATSEVAAQAATLEDISASIAAATEAATAVAVLQELVDGGLVVQIPEVEGLARSLGRVGLAPGLSRLLNGDLSTPLRIVVEADRYFLPEGARLDGSLVLVETDGIVAGTVAGNVLVAEGSLVIEPTAQIMGNVVSIESTIENLGGSIAGDIKYIEDFSPVILAPRPRVITRRATPPSFMRNVARGMGGLLSTAAVYVLMCFLGFVVVYFFRGHLETVSDTVSFSFGRSFLTGLFAEMLVLPIFVILAVLVLTWIAIPFYVLGVVLAAVLGYLAVAHAAGENLTRRRYPSWAARMRRSNSYYYVLNGLAVLLALFVTASVAEMARPILGWAQGLLIAAAVILTWVASTAGFGAVLLSHAGRRRNFARPSEVPALSVDSLASIRPARRRAESPRPKSTGTDTDTNIDMGDDREA